MTEINEDGSMVGQSFSKSYNGEHPRPKSGETYSNYHSRVRKCIDNGFHLGDLGWGDYQTYCMGSGQYDGFDSETRIS